MSLTVRTLDVDSVPLSSLEWGAFGLLVAGSFSLVWLVVSRPDSLPYRLWSRYVSHLEAQLQLMFLPARGRTIALVQAALLAALGAMNAIVPVSGSAFAALLVCFVPPFWIARMKAKRLVAVEAQLDTFTITLANALKTTPSLGDGLRISGELIARPMQDEVVYAVKAMRFGASVEQALTLTASRIGSPDVDMVFSALLIGRNIGGDLPSILYTVAASLREMTRLHQVIRSKTAEGKAQLWVLAIFPLFLMLGLGGLMPGYYDILAKSLTGYVLAAIAGVSWGGSIVIARRIMNLDM
jgi:tight adherence protein B